MRGNAVKGDLLELLANAIKSPQTMNVALVLKAVQGLSETG